MRPSVVIAATLARAGRAATAPVSPLSNVFYPGLNATAAAENLEVSDAIGAPIVVLNSRCSLLTSAQHADQAVAFATLAA